MRHLHQPCIPTITGFSAFSNCIAHSGIDYLPPLCLSSGEYSQPSSTTCPVRHVQDIYTAARGGNKQREIGGRRGSLKWSNRIYTTTLNPPRQTRTGPKRLYSGQALHREEQVARHTTGARGVSQRQEHTALVQAEEEAVWI